VNPCGSVAVNPVSKFVGLALVTSSFSPKTEANDLPARLDGLLSSCKNPKPLVPADCKDKDPLAKLTLAVAPKALFKAVARSPIVEPMLNPVRDLIERSNTPQEVFDGLSSLIGEMDSAAFSAALAETLFKARGQGDAGV